MAAIRLEVSADVRQALQSLSKFSTEIDRAGGVTEAMAKEIAASLSKATSEFSKLDLVKVTNPLAGISGEVNSSVDEIAKSFSKISNLDFTDQFEQARVKLNETIDDITNKALGLDQAFGSIKGEQLQVLQSAFLNTEKPVEQLRAEILTLGEAIGQTTNPIVLQRFGDQLARLQAQLSQKITPTVSFSTAQINTPFVQPKINTEDLQGLKVVIGSDIQSIEKLNVEIAKIKPLLDAALQGGTEDIGALQAKFNDLTTTITGLQSKAFSTAFIDDSTKSVQQLENEITVLREKINTSFDPKEIGVFAQRIEGLEAQLANIKFGGINLDTSKLTLLQSAFVETVKPIQQLEAEIKALEAAIEAGTNPAQLQVFNTQLLKLQTQLNSTRINGFQGALKGVASSLTATGAATVKTAESLRKLPNSTNSASLAVLNLGRVLQDAPFGFLGIANNLNPLLESFQRLQKESGSVGSAIKSLAGSIFGAGGLGLALSAVQFLALGGGDAIRKLAAGITEFFGATKPLINVKELFSDIFKDAGKNAGPEIAKLELIKTKLNDLSIPSAERVKLAKEYNEIADKQNRIDTTQINNLDLINSKIGKQNELILQRSIATAATAQLGTFADEFVAKSLELRQAIETTPIFQSKNVQDEKDINKRFQIAEQLFEKKAKDFITRRNALLNEVQDLQSVGGFAIGKRTRSSIEKDQDKLDEEIKRELGAQGTIILDAIDARNKAGQKLNAANEALSSLISISGLTTKITDKTGAKDKFSFLFDFLPFNPNGKLKPEQQKDLLDAIDKFQKEFSGILAGANFVGTTDQRIKQAKELDLQLKAGKIVFDAKGITDKIRAEFNKLKDEDIIPKDQLQGLSDTVVQQYLRAFDVTDTQLGNFTLPLPSIEDTLAKAKIELQRLGKELPKVFAGKDVFGNPVEINLNDLLDFTKIAPSDAIAAVNDAVRAIKKADKTLAEQIAEDLRAKGIPVKKAALDLGVAISESLQQAAQIGFAGFGEAIGKAIAGTDFGNAFQAIFSSLGGVIKQLGTEMIALSPIVRALRAAIRSLSPAALLAAGVGLVAIGTIIQSSFNKVQKFSKGGLVPGTGNQDTVPALLTPGELVIPKSKVAEVQKLLQGSTKLQIPTQLFQSIKNLALAGQNFNIPTRRLNTDAIAPLGRAQMALAGTAGQNVNVTVEGIAKGNDIVYQVAKVLRSQNRNFGRGGF